MLQPVRNMKTPFVTAIVKYFLPFFRPQRLDALLDAAAFGDLAVLAIFIAVISKGGERSCVYWLGANRTILSDAPMFIIHFPPPFRLASR